MSKAKKAALDWLSKRKDGRKRYYQCDDDNVRGIYAKGYRKAEKDLELTWNDVALILNTAEEFNRKNTVPISDEEYFKEVLKRFKDYKERK